ncbi:MAG: type II toxin-antitoxin system RelE/ParE family toxin [Eubacteriaceae bacterium]|jgi:toxin ParE1/3/4
MIWGVVYSAQARQDLRNIYQYIAHELCVPETASTQTRRIMQKIRSLDELPLRFPICEIEPWHERGLRFVSIDKYLVFYLPVEADKIVNIVRIMYGGRDIRRQLSETVDF